jgi:hypothetical protein
MVNVQNGGVACGGSVQRLSCKKPLLLECKALYRQSREKALQGSSAKLYIAKARKRRCKARVQSAKLEPDAFRERRCCMEKALYSGVAACYMVYQG